MPIFNILENATYAVYKKDKYILHQGDKIDQVIYLLEGCIRLVVTHPNGYEQNCFRYFGYEKNIPLIGAIEYFCNDGHTPCEIIAESDCRCYLIPTANLKEKLLDNPDILFSLLQKMGYAYYEMHKAYQFRYNGRIDSLFARFLLMFSQPVNGELVLDASHTNQVISRILGIHTVTTSKILATLKKQGTIVQDKDGIHIIDKEQLIRYMNYEDTLKYRTQDT